MLVPPSKPSDSRYASGYKIYKFCFYVCSKTRKETRKVTYLFTIFEKFLKVIGCI